MEYAEGRHSSAESVLCKVGRGGRVVSCARRRTAPLRREVGPSSSLPEAMPFRRRVGRGAGARTAVSHADGVRKRSREFGRALLRCR